VHSLVEGSIAHNVLAFQSSGSHCEELGVAVGIKRGESEGGGIEGIGRGQRDNGPLSNKRTAIG
jgi:hypothetical protein